MNYKEEIQNLDTFRYELINQDETPNNSEEIDKYAEKILALIKEGKNQLDFEFIIEQLTRLGQAPCLLYDDDGHFTISDEGFVTAVADGPADWEGAFFITKEKWFDTIREALDYYLSEE